QVASDVRAVSHAVVVRRRDGGACGGDATGTEQRQVNDSLLVDGVRHGAAHVDVIERRAFDVEVDTAEVGREAADDLHVGVDLEQRDVGGWYVLYEVGVAGLDGGGARRRVGIEDEGDAVEVRELVVVGVGAAEVGVALQHHAGLRQVLDEHERSRADDHVLQVAVGPHHVLGDYDVGAGGQLRQQWAERLGQGHHDRVGVGRLDGRHNGEVVGARRRDG